MTITAHNSAPALCGCTHPACCGRELVHVYGACWGSAAYVERTSGLPLCAGCAPLYDQDHLVPWSAGVPHPRPATTIADAGDVVADVCPF